MGGSVAEWLTCWTQVQKGLGSNCSHDAVATKTSSAKPRPRTQNSVSSGLEIKTVVSRTTRLTLHAGIRQEKRRCHPSCHSHQSTNFKWEFRERERMVILLTPKFLV